MRRPVVLLGLLALGLTAGLVGQHACQGPPSPLFEGPRPPNLIVIVIDTLRADMLAGPNGEPAHMPYARELARRGVLFTDVTAPAPWTLPSMGSLLTGLLPRDHGVTRMGPVPLLPAGVTTWAEILTRRGLETAAYSGAPWALDGPQGLLKGFKTPKDGFGLDGAPVRLTTWRRSLDPRRPFFLLLHSFEAHDPYGEESNNRRAALAPPPPGFDARVAREPWDLAQRFLTSRSERVALNRVQGAPFRAAVVRYLWSGYRSEPRPELAESLRRAYIDGVRWVDGLLRTTVEWLESEGLLKDTLLVVTSDHGEAFGEHGTLEHGRVLHEEVLRVPLLLVGPEPFQGGKVVREHVALLDVLPTYAELAGIAPPQGSVGRSLRGLLEGREAARVVLSQELVNFDVTQEDVDILLRSARSGRYAAVLEWDRRLGTLREHAYDRQTDAAERHDLAQGRGTLEGLELDPEICRAVDALRAELVAEGLTVPRPPPSGRCARGRTLGGAPAP